MHFHMIRQLLWPNYRSKIKCTAQILRQSINAPDKMLILLSWPFFRGLLFTAPLVARWLNYSTKGFLLCAIQSEVLPKSFEQKPSIQKAFPPLPFSPERGSGWNEQCPHLKTGPLIRGSLCWRGGRGSANKWLSHSVIIGHHCLRWAFMTCYATNSPISSRRMLNDRATLALTGLICTQKRRGGEGKKEEGREKEQWMAP